MADNVRPTIHEVKRFLRLDFTDEDEYIEQIISTSCEMCDSYLRRTVAPADTYKLAVMLLVGHFYENRETETNRELPQSVYHLLQPYREARF